MTSKIFGAALCALLAGAATGAAAKDWILTGVRPDKLVTVDASTMTIDKVITLKDAGPAPFIPVASPDGTKAWVLADKTESIIGVDLKTGEEFLRIHMSSAEERVKGLFGMDLSPDGSTIAVYQSPVKLLKNEYVVQPTRLALYDAMTGALKAAAEAPRQITVIAWSLDGKKIYGMGRQMAVFDGATAQKIDELPIHGWGGGEFVQPDVLDAWSQFEVSGMVTTPFYTFRADGNPEDPEAYRTGLLTLDLGTGEISMRDSEPTDIFYFSSAANAAKTRLYAAYNQLSSFDLATAKPIKRVGLPHSYYSVNVSTDGKTVYLAGALNDIAAYDAETLERKGSVTMPGGAAMSLVSTRLYSSE